VLFRSTYTWNGEELPCFDGPERIFKEVERFVECVTCGQQYDTCVMEGDCCSGLYCVGGTCDECVLQLCDPGSWNCDPTAAQAARVVERTTKRDKRSNVT